MIKLLHFLVLTLFIFNSLGYAQEGLNSKIFKVEDFYKKITPLIVRPIYDIDTDDLPAVVSPLFDEYKNVKATVIHESIDNEIVFQYYLKNNKPIFNKKIPQLYLEYKHSHKDIFYQKEKIGEIDIYYDDDIYNLGLTAQEKQWIKNHIVKIGVEQWAPIVFSNNGEDIDGIAGDFTKKIIKLTGLKTKVINKRWNSLINEFNKNNIDILPATYYTKARTKFGLFSEGYFKMKDALYVQSSNSQVHSMADLNGKTLAIPESYGSIEKIKEKFPKIKLVFTKDLDDSINRVLNGKVTALYEGQVVADLKIKNELIKGLKPILVKEFKAPSLHYYTNKKDPLLASIISKALSKITEQERSHILSKWVNSKNDTIELTQAEQKWLKKQKKLHYVYDNHREPFEYKNDLGIYSGIIADILNIISQKSGLEFVAINTKNWEEATKLIQEAKADMIPFVIEDKERLKYLNFTNKTLFKVPVVFITQASDENIYENVKFDLRNKTIGVVRGRAIYKKLVQKYPNFNFVLLNSLDEGFKKVQDKKIDFLAVNKSTAKYYIKIKGYNTTKIATSIDLFFEFKMALQKSLPKEALSILNKALDSISEAQINEIYNKYINVQVAQKTDWKLIGEVSFAVILIILFILWNNHKLQVRVKEKTKDLQDVLSSMEDTIEQRTHELASEKKLINSIINSQDGIVVTSDGKRITTINEAFKKFYELNSIDEFEKKYGPCICDSFEKDVDDEYLKKDMDGISWVEYSLGHPEKKHKVVIKKGDRFHIFSISLDSFMFENQKFITVVLNDITELEETKKKVESERKLTSSIINSQDSIVVTSDGKKLTTINDAFKKFYELESIDAFEKKYGPCICDSFEKDVPDEYLKKDMNGTLWVQYVLNNDKINHKVIIKKDNIPHIFSLSLDSFMFENQKFITVVLNDITELEATKKKVEEIHKHTRESIEYASLIQGAVVAQEEDIAPFFKDSFVFWEPKDTVGGDIWLFEQLRHEDECLLFVIDCTGHGVPGAFVTMIVKSIEREVVASLRKKEDLDISPAIIMGYFNKTMKKLLKQETPNSVSNAGFDGGIIYYNRRTQILKFAGAETPLFYIDTDGSFHTVKGNRYSVGYKKCDINYQYKESVIEVKEGMKFYCTTDGYLDQNGGEKDFPFGKKRFGKVIQEHYSKPMQKQKNIFIDEMHKYESMIENNDRNDDMTVVGFEIGKKSNKHTSTKIEIVKYEGVMTQNVIASATDNIEAKVEKMSLLGTLSTITIEYCQNMMNYSKNEEEGSRQIVPAGTIEVLLIDDEYYEVIAKNIVSLDDKEKIEPKLKEVQSLDKSGIKKRYRELRRSGKNTHQKGGGIGIYEIAKVSDKIEYSFEAINKDKYHFTMKSIVKKEK